MILFSKSNFGHKKIKDCGVVVTGSTPSKNNAAYWNGSIPFITPAQLGSSIPITKSDNYVTTEGSEQGRLLDENTILVCCIGSLGKVGVAGLKLITNQQINAIKFDVSKVDYRYGYFICNQLTPLLEHYAPSTTVKIIKKSTFENIKIPLPPLPEQKRIASILDATDALRSKRRQAIAMLDELLQATFLELFGDPVTNPKGWEVVSLDKLGNLDRGVSKHRPRNAPHLLGGKYPLIQTGDVANSNGFIKSYSSTYSEDGLKQSKMWDKGTLCITIAANIANTGILEFNACFPDSVVGFTSDSYARNIFVQGLFWFFQDILEKKAPQSAQKNINLNILRNFPVPFAPDNLQTQFAKIVEKVEAQKAVQQAHLAELDTLFASLQQRAFAGDL